MNDDREDGRMWRAILLPGERLPLSVLVTEEEWRDYRAINPFGCDHPEESRELRVRQVKGGGTQWREQCLVCGSSASNPVPQNTGISPPPWDEGLQRSYELRCEEMKREFEDIFIERTASIQAESEPSYADYLASDGWKKKRLRVLERDNHLCQGCLEAETTEVHHRHYADVPNEMMFDLISLCRPCHERVHKKKIEQKKEIILAAQAAKGDGEDK